MNAYSSGACVLGFTEATYQLLYFFSDKAFRNFIEHEKKLYGELSGEFDEGLHDGINEKL